MDQAPVVDMKFEAALAELENLVHSMEDGKLELEASIAAYRRGMELMKHCQAQLADAEQQIRILENGQFRDVDRAPQATGPGAQVPLGYNSLEAQ
jgi:exodeoxyribonuclease VII small subunit